MCKGKFKADFFNRKLSRRRRIKKLLNSRRFFGLCLQVECNTSDDSIIQIDQCFHFVHSFLCVWRHNGFINHEFSNVKDQLKWNVRKFSFCVWQIYALSAYIIFWLKCSAEIFVGIVGVRKIWYRLLQWVHKIFAIKVVNERAEWFSWKLHWQPIILVTSHGFVVDLCCVLKSIWKESEQYAWNSTRSREYFTHIEHAGILRKRRFKCNSSIHHKIRTISSLNLGIECDICRIWTIQTFNAFEGIVPCLKNKIEN